jgi:hypothetical protein
LLAQINIKLKNIEKQDKAFLKYGMGDVLGVEIKNIAR